MSLTGGRAGRAKKKTHSPLRVNVFAISGSGSRDAGLRPGVRRAHSEQEGHHGQYEEEEQQHAGYRGRGAGDAAETKKSSNNRDNQKNDG